MPVPKMIVTAAMMAANMALSAMRTIEGPRLQDTKASTADYGTPLNYFRGTRMLSCPCFFAKPIREVKKKRKGKGGKQVTYSGFGTFAVHIADHEIGGVLQVWFDNHLVYDLTGTGGKTYPLGDDYDLEANMRVYTGAETQEPDPDMLAFIEARDGAGTCPAYRGTSYIYFESIPLEMLGNRYPDVKVLAYIGDVAASQWRLYFPDGCVAEAGGERRLSLNEIEFFATAESVVDLTGNGGDSFASDFASPNTHARAFDNTFGSGSNWTTNVGADVGSHIGWEFTSTVSVGAFRVRSAHANGAAWAPQTIELQYFDGSDWVTRTRYEGPLGWTGDEQWVEFVSGPTTDSIISFPTATVADLLTFVAQRGGLESGEYDFSQSAGAEHEFTGYNWTQGTGKQIVEAVADLFDVDLRPHNFILEALPRGGASGGDLETSEFAAAEGAPFSLTRIADTDLPGRVFLTYADTESGQNPNVATPTAADPNSGNEASFDMQTLALAPGTAQQLAERTLRRLRFGRVGGEFGLTRQRVGIEPGDVWAPSFDGDDMTMRCKKLTVGADGVLKTEWERDDPAIASLSGSAGAGAAGWVEDAVPDSVATTGNVLDLPLLIDAHDQSAPLAYLAAGPDEPGTWTGADFAMSDTGDLDSYLEQWDGIASGDGAVIGTCATALPAALPWLPDMGSSVSVTINAGELTAATLDELLLDATRNLAAIQSGDGWELVQFMTPTLTGTLTYTITGFLRGVRGTEWAIAGHAISDRFILLDTVKRRTLGASEIGDEDWYIAGPTGQTPVEADAFSVTFTGASHKPYAPVHAVVEQSGADWTFNATRRTRLGGTTLDGQDVPLGESSESWSLDIMDGATVKRTITGTSLPLTYTEADQITDWGSAQGTVSANLYQVNPTLSLRGYPLAIAA